MSYHECSEALPTSRPGKETCDIEVKILLLTIIANAALKLQIAWLQWTDKDASADDVARDLKRSAEAKTREIKDSWSR